MQRQLMEVVPPRYTELQGRDVVIHALTPVLQSWLAETVTEPIPEELAVILQRMDSPTTTETP
jgi:uncharacterized protein with HEPN domain